MPYNNLYLKELNKLKPKKASKVELKNSKLELGLIDDIMKDIEFGLVTGKEMKTFVDNLDANNQELNEITEKYNQLIKEFNKNAEESSFLRKDLQSAYERGTTKYEKIVKGASDLGIDVPTKIEQDYKKLEEVYSFQENAYPKEFKKRNEI